MSKLFRYCSAVLVLLCLAIPVSMMGQGAGFGSISGVVQDPSGAVITGAKVVIANESKGIRRELETGSTGTFNIPALVPASGYTVTVTKSGFAGYLAKDVTVLVGQSVTLQANLAVSAGASVVEVTAVAPLVDLSKTNVSQIVDSNQILSLPTNGRRVDAFVLLTPGTMSDGTFGLLAFRGNPGGNSFLTDGNDTTNSYYDENAGRTRTYNISQDAVQEFQVVTSNFSAEFGKASGGVVNTVTRSGSNAFHGSAYEFFRNRTLNAVDRTTANGLAPQGINPPEWRHQAGISVGGPIKKDKLFYFVNGEIMRRNAPIVSSNIGSGAGNNLFDGSANIKPTVYNPCVTAIGATRCDEAVTYLKSRVVPTLIPRTMDNNMLFAKLDWRPTDKDTISFSGNYLDFRSPNGIQTQLSLANGNAIGNNGDTNVFDRTGRASWTRLLSTHAINEFRFGLFKDRQYDPAATSLMPSIGPIGLSVNSVSNVGFATNYPRLNPSELRFQFSDTLSWTVGKHTLKFGADFTHVEDFVRSMPSQFGSYNYSSLTNFATDFSGNTTSTRNYTGFSQTFGNPEVDVKVKEYAFFVQDEYRVTPKLIITPGLRYDYTSIPQPETCATDPRFSATCKIPGTKLNFAPRLGIAYALNEKSSIHASYGLFQNRYTTATIENLFVSNGVYQQSYSFTNANGPVFPNFFAPTFTGGTAATPNILFADPNFRNPYSQQAEIGIQTEVAKNTTFSMSYNWSRGLHLLQTRNDNVLDPTTKTTADVKDATGAVVGTFDVPLYTQRNPVYNGYTGGVYELQTSGNSYYNGLLIQLNRRYTKWFEGSVAYTWSHTIDYNQSGAPTFGSAFATSVTNGDYKGEKGSSSLDARHRVVINAVFNPSFNFNNKVAKQMFNGWQMAVIDVVQSAQPLVPTIFTSSSAPGLVNPSSTRTLNGLSGSTRVPWESLSELNIGSIYRTDARLSKTFPVTERVNFSLGFEAFNIFNHLIPSGRQTQQYTATYGSGKYTLTPNSAYNTINATQATPDGTTARRAQAVVRINF